MRLLLPLLVVALGMLPFLHLACASRVPPGLLTAADLELPAAPCPAGEAPEAVRVSYLGNGGLLIRHRGASLLTAPFFSNPPLLRVGLSLPIAPRPERIEAGLPPVADVPAVLVGHSHYDHLMDLPYLLATGKLSEDAVLYGNRTMLHLLAPVDPGDGRLVAVDDLAGDHRRPGEWIAAGPRVRFMALSSEHAPHLFGIKLYGGRAAGELDRLPRTATGWLEGRTHAFLIDLLDEAGGVVFRIHYQDAASTPPRGFPPPGVIAERPIDLAVLCVAAFAQVDGYPERLLAALRPRHVLLAHWEDFFRDPAAEPMVVRATDLGAFLDRLPADQRWTLPAPGVTVSYPVCGGGSAVRTSSSR